MDISFIRWLIEDVGSLVVVMVLGAMVANRSLEYLREQAEAEKVRQKSWDEQRRDDNKAFIEMMGGLKLSIEAQTLGIKQSTDLAKERDIAGLAYQNTSSNALNELVVNVQKLAGVPDGVRKANDTLGVITKQQTVMSEGEAKHDLEMRQQLAKTNNALVEMQKELKRMSVAMGKLPDTMQATIAPLVGMMQTVLSTAQATNARLDDMPFMPIGETDKTVYASTNGDAPHPAIEVIPTPNPSPLNGEGNSATGGES